MEKLDKLDKVEEDVDKIRNKLEDTRPESEVIDGLRINQLNPMPDLQQQGHPYIELSWQKSRESSQRGGSLHEKVMEFLGDDEKKVLLIGGGAGAGKTLYSKVLTHRLWAETDFKQGGPIPLYVHLAMLRDPVHSLIEQALEKYEVTKDEMKSLKKNRSFILILDGYDEINDLQNLYDTNKLNDWDVKVIITSRLYYWGERYRFVPQGNIQAYDEVIVSPLDEEEIKVYLNNYNEHSQKPVEYEDLEKVKGLLEIVKTPLLLWMLTEVLEEVMALERFRRTELYRLFTEKWFDRQRGKRTGPGELKRKEPNYWKYVEKLSGKMAERGVLSVEYEQENEFESKWKSYVRDLSKELEIQSSPAQEGSL